jgi:hypothetical protein
LLLNIHERQTLDYEAADELDRLNAQALELCAEISGLRRENEALKGLLRELRRDYAGAALDFDTLREIGVTLTERAVKIADIKRRIDRIDAALAGAAVQPSSPADGQPVAEGVARAEVVPYPYGEGRTDQPAAARKTYGDQFEDYCPNCKKWRIECKCSSTVPTSGGHSADPA